MKSEEMFRRLIEGEDPLELSIEKWKDIVDNNGLDVDNEDCDSANCALCQVYDTEQESCRHCPVNLSNKSNGGCYNTPYTTWYYNKTKENAQAKLDFLISLRPKKEKVK